MAAYSYRCIISSILVTSGLALSYFRHDAGCELIILLLLLPFYVVLGFFGCVKRSKYVLQSFLLSRSYQRLLHVRHVKSTFPALRGIIEPNSEPSKARQMTRLSIASIAMDHLECVKSMHIYFTANNEYED